MPRSLGIYDKFFVVQDAAGLSLNQSVDYDTASFDFNGAAMHGLPFASSIQKYSFCAVPGDYTIHAVDNGGHGWWGGAFFVAVGGETVLHQEMGQTSSSKQSTTFTVTLSESARTSFSENKAVSGGGAMFWEDVEPDRLEAYRNTSGSNEAAYGAYVATPIRTLSTRSRRSSYDAVSGATMGEDPITLDLRDR